ncbi:MAG TPA: hypothetical protein VFS94_01680 [Gemmatimonadales bacterium]|nr:hypothetical protein [Gemmatimonadales bacterium]
MPRGQANWPLAGVVLSVLALAGCNGSTDPVDRDLDLLLQAVEPYEEFAAAQTAGYTLLFENMCMEDPDAGGMGYHYVDVSLLDATVTVAEPEALIFEGAPGEDRELVAVEYVVPFAAVPEDQPAPTLFGEAFRKNQAFGLWTLHVWAWKDNPDGTFADWNPRVSCP